ncbi:MAG TPA: FAD-binding protein, partial [bacterium]|nr:FAD-binding protein [bacterium]
MTEYNKLTDKLINQIERTFGAETVIYNDKFALEPFGKDEGAEFFALPELVFTPQDESNIKEILEIALKNKVPLTVRGGGTGVTGAAVPIFGGIVLNMQKLNKILDIDKKNFCVETQVGVINKVLQDAVEKEGLFYPPDPNSLDNCTIGGNIATCAGGPRAVKYGITRNYVYNINAIFPNGAISNYGGRYEKTATGYNLTHLLIGSEGTLAIFYRAVLKLLLYPNKVIDLLALFKSFEDASNAIPKILAKNLQISVCEFIDNRAIKYSEKFLNSKFQYSDEAAAQLLIQVDGFDEEEVEKISERCAELLLEFNALDVFIASDKKNKEKLWGMRRNLRDALKHIGKDKLGEDVTVPRSRISELLIGARKIGKLHKINVVSYGHTGDGNVHINVVKDDLS